MSRQKRITVRQKISFAVSWIRHPAFLILFIAFLGVFTFALGLALPCGRYSNPVHGHCTNGRGFFSPLSFFWIGAAIAFILSLFLISRELNEGKWSNKQFVKGIFETISKRPKWRKRWYPLAFIAVYCPLAALTFLMDRDSGLRWYNYFGQYALVLPLLASLPASWLLTKIRRVSRMRR